MVNYCCVRGCKSVYNKTNISFHKFPKSQHTIHQAWLNAVDNKKLKPSPSTVICSKHFTRDDFVVTRRRYLKANAIPSLNLMQIKKGAMYPVEQNPSTLNTQNMCMVKGCTSVQNNLNVYFVRFPARKEMQDKWMEVLKDKCNPPSINSYICTAHFAESDFTYSKRMNRNFLKTNSIPSVFSNIKREIPDPEDQQYCNDLMDKQGPVRVLRHAPENGPLYFMQIPGSNYNQPVIFTKPTEPVYTPPIVFAQSFQPTGQISGTEKTVVNNQVPAIKKEVLSDDESVETHQEITEFKQEPQDTETEEYPIDIKQEPLENHPEVRLDRIKMKSEIDHNYARRDVASSQTEDQEFSSYVYTNPQLMHLRQKLKNLQHLLHVKHLEYMKRKRYIMLMTSPKAMEKRIEYLKKCLKLKAIKTRKRKEYIMNRALDEFSCKN